MHLYKLLSLINSTIRKTQHVGPLLVTNPHNNPTCFEDVLSLNMNCQKLEFLGSNLIRMFASLVMNLDCKFGDWPLNGECKSLSFFRFHHLKNLGKPLLMHL